MKADREMRWLKRYAELYRLFYAAFIRRTSPQKAHDIMKGLLRHLDELHFALRIASRIRRATVPRQPVTVGGVGLSQRLILAAGLVKGDGYADETVASSDVAAGKNILPGWSFMPALCGPVEFGSFTRHPRVGNRGQVIWRDDRTRSTQNRMGLPNPGAEAAARFLAKQKPNLPPEYGINIAISPEAGSVEQRRQDSVEAIDFFLNAGVVPSWFTLNLSCPNTFDDPRTYQLESEARRVCQALVERLKRSGCSVPLWVKLSPGLQAQQYETLVRVCQDVGVKAIVATNTLPQQIPGDPNATAGLGGGDLFGASLQAVARLHEAINRYGANVDIVACGGIMNGDSFRAHQQLGVKAGQYWSALVFRGPLAAAVIQSEMASDEYDYAAVRRESLA